MSERKSVSDRLRENNERLNKKNRANLHMASKLLELLENDKIVDGFDMEFIPKVHKLLLERKALSVNQELYLEKLNYKY